MYVKVIFIEIVVFYTIENILIASVKLYNTFLMIVLFFLF